MLSLNPLRLVDRVLDHVVNRAIGLTEDEKAALVTPEAIEAMWTEAYGIADDYAALDRLERRGYFECQAPDSRP